MIAKVRIPVTMFDSLRKLARVFAPNRSTEPQYVNLSRPGDGMIEQGTRLNVLTTLLNSPDSPDMFKHLENGEIRPLRGYAVTANVTGDEKLDTCARLARQYYTRKKSDDSSDNSKLAAELVEARTSIGKLHSRSMPVGR